MKPLTQSLQESILDVDNNMKTATDTVSLGANVSQIIYPIVERWLFMLNSKHDAQYTSPTGRDYIRCERFTTNNTKILKGIGGDYNRFYLSLGSKLAKVVPELEKVIGKKMYIKSYFAREEYGKTNWRLMVTITDNPHLRFARTCALMDDEGYIGPNTFIVSYYHEINYDHKAQDSFPTADVYIDTRGVFELTNDNLVQKFK